MLSHEPPLKPSIQRLTGQDLALMREVNTLFGKAFAEPHTYGGHPPGDDYLRQALDKPHVIALAALAQGEVIGGLVAYEMDKLEQARREIYIYDLAVDEAHRRRGVATALIGYLRQIAHERRAWVVFVQADYGDDPAIALYEKLGTREEVLHFDLDIGDGALST